MAVAVTFMVEPAVMFTRTWSVCRYFRVSTLTVTETLLPPKVAVTVVVPAPVPVIRPSTTSATL
ncbi:hypothetical protein D3C81_1815260 [compost metagenome]